MEIEMDVSGVHQHLHHHHHQQQQELQSQTLESMLVCSAKAAAEAAAASGEKKPRPPAAEEALKCPRCDSSNTKFCYYNNYSLTQPRYFCKSCRRYWTKGGTLRNVPVGGGCRKNKRSSSSSSTSTTTTSACTSSSSSALSKMRDHHHLMHQHPLNPNLIMNHLQQQQLSSAPPHSTDLSLAFARLANGGGYDHHYINEHHLGSTSNGDQMGFLDVIRAGGFLHDNNTSTTNGFQNHHVLYNGDHMGNLLQDNQDHHLQQQQMMVNPNMFEADHQEMTAAAACSAATTAVTMTTVKQETCNMMMRSSSTSSSCDQVNVGDGRAGGGVLWGFPWQMGDQAAGNMMQQQQQQQQQQQVHEVESAAAAGRSIIGGGWNGIGSTNWHGLINSPLM